MPRIPVRVLLLWAGLALAGPSPAPAGDGESDPAVATPRTVEDLVALEARVRTVAAQVAPATVGLRQRNGTQGSGVVVSAAGLVLSAAHVLGPRGSRCTVLFPDGRRAEARTLGSDLDADVGMLQIVDPGPWPCVPIRDRLLEAGEWCVATGHPGGFEAGRPPVVRLGRVQRGWSRSPFVRSDCQIIRGDSGGPLVDLDGHLIGVHSRLEERFTSNYHVPMDAFRERWELLRGGGFAGRPRLGIRGETAAEGCRILTVDEGSAADLAGLEVGDRIVELGGREVHGIEDLRGALAALRAGDEVRVVVLRESDRVELRATLGLQGEGGE